MAPIVPAEFVLNVDFVTKLGRACGHRAIKFSRVKAKAATRYLVADMAVREIILGVIACTTAEKE